MYGDIDALWAFLARSMFVCRDVILQWWVGDGRDKLLITKTDTLIKNITFVGVSALYISLYFRLFEPSQNPPLDKIRKFTKMVR